MDLNPCGQSPMDFEIENAKFKSTTRNMFEFAKVFVECGHGVSRSSLEDMQRFNSSSLALVSEICNCPNKSMGKDRRVRLLGNLTCQAGHSSVGRASDCRFMQQSDGPWFDSG